MNREPKRNAPLVSAVLAALLAPCWAQADTDSEREALARLAHEIQALGGLVTEAEEQSPGGERFPFQYGWLRQDLAKIRGGIVEFLNAPRGEPRAFPPLRGDYRR
jgi:RAQPRD family integrative conjugative element protein